MLKLDDIFKEPLRYPAGYPIQIGFQTFFLWNASRCIVYPEADNPKSYSLILSNLSVTHPVFMNNEITKQDGFDHLTLYLITEVCNIVYTIGETKPLNAMPVRYGNYLEGGILCEYSARVIIDIPDYILPSGCYLFIVSRNFNRPAKCYRTALPVDFYTPYNFKPGMPIAIPLKSDLSSLSELGKDLLGLQDDDIPIESSTNIPKLPKEQYEYYRMVYYLIYNLFFSNELFSMGNVEDILTINPQLHNKLFYDVVKSMDDQSLFVETKHYTYKSSSTVHPYMEKSDVLWRPISFFVSEENLRNVYERVTEKIFSLEEIVSTLLGKSYMKDKRLDYVVTFTLDCDKLLTYDPYLKDDCNDDTPSKQYQDMFYPSIHAQIVFRKIERVTINLESYYNIRAFRRVTKMDGQGCPLKNLLDSIQTMFD